jgi:hypothetical protein
MANQNPSTSNGQSKDFTPASPNAGSLGMYGQVPVGNYTGTVVVQVPLYDMTYKNFKLPIGVSYHGSGNRPDLFPGEVGLGWALQAGGVITRVVKGLPDFEKYPSESTQLIPVVWNPTGASDWSTTAKLNQLLTNGYFIPDDQGNSDEYYFEFGGVSGKFYLGHDTAYQLKSSDNQYFSIKGELIEGKKFKMPTLEQRPDWTFTVPYTDTLLKDRMVYKFTITDGQGVKYIFGGTDNSIEFSRPGFRSGAVWPALPAMMVTPNSWFLTSIEFPNGQKILLDYKRHTFVTKVSTNNVERTMWYKQGSSTPTTSGGLQSFARAEKSTLINGCYLSSIITPKEVITFDHSEAKKQLKFPADSTLSSPFITNENLFIRYKDVHNAWYERLLPLKLDTISIRDRNGKLFRRVAFQYTESDTTRLKLMAVNIFGGNFITPQRYSFEYNPLSLPPYLSYKTDHFGFYNGRNPYITTNNVNNYLPPFDSALFTQSKDAVPAYLQAEMLTKIIYPTLGYTTFEYEPHDYSSFVTTWPFSVTANPSNTTKTTGGLRIKKVASYDGTGQVSMAKQYFYKKNYAGNGTASSGVLAFTPTYIENYSGTVVPPARKNQPITFNGTLSYYRWSNNPIFPMGMTRGNHVTYSEVTEVNADGGFTVYKYKNYDNGYNDLPPLNYVSDNTGLKQFWKEDEGISMNLERGQQLSEEMYDASKTIKAKKIFKYNDDPNRFSRHVRVISQTTNSVAIADIPSYRIVASLIYTYFPYLKEEVSYLYGTNNDSIVSTLKYTYDTTYRLQKTTEIINSDGRVHKMIYRYPQDMLSTSGAITYNKMVTRSMVNFMVERERQEDNVKVETDLTEYAEGLSFNNTLIFPSTVRTQFMSQASETRSTFNLYDSTDNVLMTTKSAGTAGNGIQTCYIWSYNNQHPVAVIQNATFSNIETVLGGRAAITAFGRTMPTDAEVHAFLAPLRSNALLSTALVNSYTYDPLVGMTSMTDANNKRSYYEYDNFGRLSIIRDHDSLIIKTICYNYAGFVEDCSKGRMDYVKMEVYRATTAAGICNAGPLVQTLNAYSPRSERINSSGTPVLSDRKEFYFDQNFTNPLPTGYYKINGGSGYTPGGTYWYIVDGKYVYRNICGGTEPQWLKYYDTTYVGMCDANLPLVPVFGTIVVGNSLSSDLLSPPVKDGYYVYNGNYFHTTNGIVDSIRTCSSLLQSLSTNVAQSILPSSNLCTFIKSITIYHSLQLQLGIYLYTDPTLSTPVTARYYSDGINTYRTDATGIIISVTPCP